MNKQTRYSLTQFNNASLFDMQNKSVYDTEDEINLASNAIAYKLDQAETDTSIHLQSSKDEIVILEYSRNKLTRRTINLQGTVLGGRQDFEHAYISKDLSDKDRLLEMMKVIIPVITKFIQDDSEVTDKETIAKVHVDIEGDADQICQEDMEMAAKSPYTVVIQAGMPKNELADIALDIFHDQVAVDALEDFEFTVSIGDEFVDINPEYHPHCETKGYVK